MTWELWCVVGALYWGLSAVLCLVSIYHDEGVVRRRDIRNMILIGWAAFPLLIFYMLFLEEDFYNKKVFEKKKEY
jgi:hypothetical protein